MKGAMHSLWERARMDTLSTRIDMQASGSKTLANSMQEDKTAKNTATTSPSLRNFARVLHHTPVF